jgi:hypothetical protein
MMIKMKGKPLNLSASKAKVQSKTTGGIQLWCILLSLYPVHMREQCEGEKKIHLEISTRLHVFSIPRHEEEEEGKKQRFLEFCLLCDYACMYVCMYVCMYAWM